eukprot:TRINITY_DN7165_c0_g1_i1.p1 TRINITY_DN7165_c0_g1~~TRINITY_DN7165_c0_g1_i1.p1  ORF type:complete len:428 (-),score=68.38 TRINITY_DN7165_c0_g1_i1:214-1497(-)
MMHKSNDKNGVFFNDNFLSGNSSFVMGDNPSMGSLYASPLRFLNLSPRKVMDNLDERVHHDFFSGCQNEEEIERYGGAVQDTEPLLCFFGGNSSPDNNYMMMSCSSDCEIKKNKESYNPQTHFKSEEEWALDSGLASPSNYLSENVVNYHHKEEEKEVEEQEQLPYMSPNHMESTPTTWAPDTQDQNASPLPFTPNPSPSPASSPSSNKPKSLSTTGRYLLVGYTNQINLLCKERILKSNDSIVGKNSGFGKFILSKCISSGRVKTQKQFQEFIATLREDYEDGFKLYSEMARKFIGEKMDTNWIQTSPRIKEEQKQLYWDYQDVCRAIILKAVNQKDKGMTGYSQKYLVYPRQQFCIIHSESGSSVFLQKCGLDLRIFFFYLLYFQELEILAKRFVIVQNKNCIPAARGMYCSKSLSAMVNMSCFI